MILVYQLENNSKQSLNKCWNNSFIQMLYNITDFRNKPIFNTPTIDCDMIFEKYNYKNNSNLKSLKVLDRNIKDKENVLLLIAAIKDLFKLLLNGDLLNIELFMEQKNIKYFVIYLMK